MIAHTTGMNHLKITVHLLVSFIQVVNNVFAVGLVNSAKLCGTSEIGLFRQAHSIRTVHRLRKQKGNLLKCDANIGFNKRRLLAVKIVRRGQGKAGGQYRHDDQTVRTKRKVQCLYLKKCY